MELSAINNGVHCSASERPNTTSPVDRIPSTYFPAFPPLPGTSGSSDGPFFPPGAEAFMQAAAAAAARAAIGRPMPGQEAPSLGARTTEFAAADGEPTRRGRAPEPPPPCSPPVGDDDDAMSALSCPCLLYTSDLPTILRV